MCPCLAYSSCAWPLPVPAARGGRGPLPRDHVNTRPVRTSHGSRLTGKALQRHLHDPGRCLARMEAPSHAGLPPGHPRGHPWSHLQCRPSGRHAPLPRDHVRTAHLAHVSCWPRRHQSRSMPPQRARAIHSKTVCCLPYMAPPRPSPRPGAAASRAHHLHNPQHKPHTTLHHAATPLRAHHPRKADRTARACKIPYRLDSTTCKVPPC